MILKGVLLMSLIFGCNPDNDLFLALQKSGYECRRFDTHEQAIENAPQGSSVLLLSDNYPTSPTKASDMLFKKAEEKNLRLFVEYFSAIPGLNISPPKHAQWERCVVSSAAFGESLPLLRIMMAHDCYFTPVETNAESLLVLARVAGFDRAVFGLPEKKYPILFEIPDRRLFVATSCLSNFQKGRYAPREDWKTLWKYLLKRLEPGEDWNSFDWRPLVAPSYSREEPLSPSYEKIAFSRVINWIFHSKLLVQESRKDLIHSLLRKTIENYPKPDDSIPDGDGSLGFMEGYASSIKYDGHQVQRLPLRTDCMAEVAMLLALDWRLNKTGKSRDVSRNLLDYIYFHSNLQAGKRGDPRHPAYGLIAWGDICPNWEKANYTDDDARVILASLAASSALGSSQWDRSLVKALLANLRTTGPLGFRSDRIDISDLEKNGWKFYHDTERINYSTHHESYIWACYLWAYRKTGFVPFLQKAKKGIQIMMQGYPNEWRWRDNIERARILLCLSWLIRVEDTGEHRKWLQTIITDLLRYQEPCGAIREIPAYSLKNKGYAIQTNETYGTGETPIIQEDGDSASDQLYTTGFALLGLHEAFAATGDVKIKEAEDKLAEYLCRIQIRSDAFPYLDGAWFRAFDFKRWEYWAGSGDVGWGAWSVESGWCQAWLSAILALRMENISLWDFTQKSKVKDQFNEVLKELPQE